MVRSFSIPRRLALGTTAGLLGAALIAGSAAAGGWATATLDDTMGGPTAGKPTEVGFTLKQHGVSPINWEMATFVGRNPETGESVRAQARPSGGPGHYVATVTFPSSGNWTWYLELRDLLYGLPDGSQGADAAQPLTVAPPVAPPPAETARPSGADPLLVAAVGLLMFLLGAIVGSFRGSDRRTAAKPAATGQLVTR